MSDTINPKRQESETNTRTQCKWEKSKEKRCNRNTDRNRKYIN